jgi:hypothetical protein
VAVAFGLTKLCDDYISPFAVSPFVLSFVLFATEPCAGINTYFPQMDMVYFLTCGRRKK